MSTISTRSTVSRVSRRTPYALSTRARKAPSRKILKKMIKSQITKMSEPMAIIWDHWGSFNNTSDVTWAQTLYDLTTIPQGDGEGQRDGLQVTLKSLEYNLRVWFRGGSPYDRPIRVIFFRWHDINTPNIAAFSHDLLDMTGDLLGIRSYGVIAPLRKLPHSSDKKFTILSDRRYMLDYNNKSGLLIKGRLNLKNSKCNFISDVNDTWANGHIGIWMCHDSTVDVTAGPPPTEDNTAATNPKWRLQAKINWIE